LPSYAGFRLQEEVVEIGKIKNDFVHPAVAIIGGAKIEPSFRLSSFSKKNMIIFW